MKHKRAKFILGRTANKRRELLQSLTSGLLEHGGIKTTRTKAEAVRRFCEPLITEAKKDLTLHRRRRLLAKLSHKRDLEFLLKAALASKSRAGGYTRVIKLESERTDEAPMVRLELVD
jgi:large subunit ribosomal protein L17